MAFNTSLAFDVIARDRASKTFHDVGRGADAVGTKLAGFAKAGAAAVAGFALAGAAAVTALAGAAAQFSLQKSKADALLAGQLRATGPQAKDLGKAAGQLYAEGWAESVEEAGSAIRATIRAKLVDKDAGAQAIEAMSTRTAALAVDMEEDFDRVARAVSKMLRTGIADSAEEAFDLLHAATAGGVNDSQDLLDTINEYSVQFQALGIDAPQALGLMSQALQAGARDSDTAADAIKEFAIRSKDGSAKSRKAFQDLKLDADKMFQTFARGGPEADAAMKLVIDRIKQMEDPVKRDAAVVALFGTKAEDLQAALFAMDPRTAVEALGKVAGASDEFIKSQESAGQQLDKLWRGTMVALDGLLLPAINAIIGKIDEWANDPEIQAWFADLRAEVTRFAEGVMPLIVEGWEAVTSAFKDNKEEITMVVKGLVGALGLLLAVILGMSAVTIRAAGLMADAWRVMFGLVLGYIDFFVQAAAKAFGWVPGIGDDLKKAAAEFATFRERVNNELAGITDHVNIRVNWQGVQGITGKQNQMDLFLGRRAHGGPVTAGQPYIVGEHRPELFVPDQNGMILPRVPTAGAGAGASGPTVIEFRSDGTRLGNLLLEMNRETVRIHGRGNVQVAYGR